MLLGDDPPDRRPPPDDATVHDRTFAVTGTESAEPATQAERQGQDHNRYDDDQHHDHPRTPNANTGAFPACLLSVVMSPQPEKRKPELVLCAGAVVRDASGRVLLVRRGHEPGLGLWSLPGGRVEAGEAPAAAAGREVLEETGLEVEVGDLLATFELGPYLVHDFAATVVGGELAAGDDADEVGWFAVDELSTVELSAGLLDALTSMLQLRS